MMTAKRNTPHAHFRLLWVCLCGALLLSATVSAAAPAPALFKDGDRVCFIGDSITHGDYDKSDYHEFIYLYYLTRFPDRKITIFDRGISGDTSWGTFRRFDKDIAPCKATVSTIMLGMNDVNRGLYGSSPKCSPAIQAKRDARLKQYREHMEKLCKQVAGTGSRMVLFTPSPFDQTSFSRGDEALMPARPRVNDGLVVCAGYCRTLAESFGAALVDMNSGMLRVLERQHKVDPTFSFYGKYRVHPDTHGHFVMAYLFLKAQNAPAVVSTVKIDAAGKKVLEQANCTVTDLATAEGTVRFTLAAKALPFPTDEVGALGLGLVPFMQELNREAFCVTGLKPGAYALKIDDRTVGHYDASQLADGTNLAENHQTPQYQQAARVAAMNMQRDNLSCKLRGMALLDLKTLNRFKGDKTDMAKVRAFFDKTLAGMEGKTWHPFFKKQFDGYMESKPRAGEIAAEMGALEKELYRIDQPKPHRYELTRTGDTLPLPVAEKIAEPEGLTFYLPFDKTVAAAKSEPACTAIGPVEVTYETGPVGDAVVIANGAGLRYPEPESFPLNGSSMAFWVKPHWDLKETQDLPFIFRKDDPKRVGRHLINHQEIRLAAYHEPKDRVKLLYSSSPGLTKDGKFPPCGCSYAKWVAEDWGKDQWLHVCVTVKKFGRRWGTRMYVQGKIAAVGQWQTPPEAHGKTFTFAGGKRPMSIDDFRAYNRVLTAEEVHELYRMGARRAMALNLRQSLSGK